MARGATTAMCVFCKRSQNNRLLSLDMSTVIAAVYRPQYLCWSTAVERLILLDKICRAMEI